ncbi:MAG: hypothetical protein HY043_03195 [Verrucomicrobia bacterium]|nr:hypothetical protein [Verrucomicrobiota bacterium]
MNLKLTVTNTLCSRFPAGTLLTCETDEEPIDGGGFGELFRIRKLAGQERSNLCVKLFHMTQANGSETGAQATDRAIRRMRDLVDCFSHYEFTSDSLAAVPFLSGRVEMNGNSTAAIVMPYIEGGDLAKASPKNLPFPSRIVAAYSLAKGVRTLHADSPIPLRHPHEMFVLGDIAPGNVIIDRSVGNNYPLYLIDLDGSGFHYLGRNHPTAVNENKGDVEDPACPSPSKEGDRYALAVLIDKLFFSEHHARSNDDDFRKKYCVPEAKLTWPGPRSEEDRQMERLVGGQIMELLRHTFNEGRFTPSERKRALEWEAALASACQSIYQCPHCSACGIDLDKNGKKNAVCGACAKSIALFDWKRVLNGGRPVVVSLSPLEIKNKLWLSRIIYGRAADVILWGLGSFGVTGLAMKLVEIIKHAH